MKPVLVQTLRSRWLVAGVHAGAWLLLYLAVTGYGGKSPDYRDSASASTPVQSPAPVARLASLFSPGVWPIALVDTNLLNPFFTRHFIPTQTPAPPPPTTRKIELTYQGFYQPVDGSRHVIVKVADAFLTASEGAKITANLYAAEATMQALTLTNPAAQTNLLLLNIKKEIEVPIQ